MSQIKGRDTKPEMIVRRLVHGMGFRYRLHRRDLPGRPDLVFPKLRKVIFVHGCFWHMHTCRYGSVTPKTNAEFWQTKRLSNVERDGRNLNQINELGWESLVVWECSKHDLPALQRQLVEFLEAPSGKTMKSAFRASPVPSARRGTRGRRA